MRVCLAGRHAPALLRMVAVLLGAMTFSAASSSANLYVTTTGNNAGNCQTLGAPCLTIAYALSQAAAGDTINIGGGTFTEELTISKSVVLNGAGMASTIIKAPAVLTSNPAVPGGSPGQQTTIVFVTGATTSATIQNLQIQGPGSSTCGSIGYGIFAGGGANLTLSNNHVLMIRDISPPLSSCQNGSAIRYGAPSTAQAASPPPPAEASKTNSPLFNSGFSRSDARATPTLAPEVFPVVATVITTFPAPEGNRFSTSLRSKRFAW